jgi:transcription antitermination protein NusB
MPKDGAMSHARHLARVMAMQALYEVDAVDGDPAAALDAVAAEHQARPRARTFASDLVQGVLHHLEAIDAVIRAAAPQWPLAQVAGVDKAVLRVAVFELLFGRRVPPKVAINEAIDIAKTYGGEGSGRFVNGVLGHVLATALAP